MADEDAIIDLADGPAEAPADVPVLAEDGTLAQDLPRGAVRQDDGSVIYTLRHRCVLKYRRPSDGVVREEPITALHLHRLTGADMRAIAAAKDDATVVVAIARSARMNEARMALIFDRMDGEDAAAAGEVVSGSLGTGRTTGR
jgi:hypothetical protein